MDPVVRSIQAELEAKGDDAIRHGSQRFFKEPVCCHGVRSLAVREIADNYWKKVKSREKSEIFQICEELYQTGHIEEAFIVSSWVPRLRERYDPEDFKVFERWIEEYITNWATCDGFCNHTIGDFIERFPEFIGELKRWTASQNRWMRRAAAVSLIVPAKRGKHLADVLEIADLLLIDPDDMVQKGYGWLLKEASRQHQTEVFAYVMQNKKVMPRTALRYAIELMPKDLKTRAMKRD